MDEEELKPVVEEMRATAMALDAKIETLKKTIGAIEIEIELFKIRFKHHINLMDAHKEPIEE